MYLDQGFGEGKKQGKVNPTLRDCSINLNISLSTDPDPWAQEISWITGKFSGKAFRNVLRKLAGSAMIYFIWSSKEFKDSLLLLIKSSMKFVSRPLNADL